MFFLREKRLSVCQFESAGRRRLKKTPHTIFYNLYCLTRGCRPAGGVKAGLFKTFNRFCRVSVIIFLTKTAI